MSCKWFFAQKRLLVADKVNSEINGIKVTIDNKTANFAWAYLESTEKFWITESIWFKNNKDDASKFSKYMYRFDGNALTLFHQKFNAIFDKFTIWLYRY